MADFIINQGDESIAFFVCDVAISPGDKTYSAVFRIILNHSKNDVKASLVFITNAELITPILYFDILPVAYALIQTKLGVELEDCHVFIDSTEKTKGVRSQIWTFATPLKSESVLVTLTPDGKGGTHYTTEEIPRKN